MRLIARPDLGLLFVAAVAAAAVGLYNYVTPLTGVTGTAGALLVVVTSVIMAWVALALAYAPQRGMRVAWRVLLLILAAGTLFAGVLLHEWWLCAALTVALLALAFNTFMPARTPRAA